MPLYPLTLGLTIRIVGEGAVTLGLLNVALHVASILVARSAMPRGALRDLISSIAILYPPLLTSSGLILQESLLAFTLALVFVTARRALAVPHKRAAFVSGIAIGLSALAKTTVIPAAFLLGAVLWRTPKGAPRVLSMLLGCVLVLSPLIAHNWLAFGSFGVANSNGAVNFFAGTASNNIQPDWDSFPELLAAQSAWGAEDPKHRPSLEQFLIDRAFHRIAADPFRWISLACERAVRFALPARHWFFAMGLSKPASLGPIYAVAIACQALLFAAIGWLAFAVLRGRHSIQDLAAPILVFGHQLVYSLSYASPRYGATIGPILFGGLALALAGAPGARSASTGR